MSSSTRTDLFAVIARASGGRKIPFPIGKEVDRGTHSMRRFFMHRERWVSPENGVTFDELGDRIRPGYYARIGGGGHSIFFLTWCDAGRNPIRFQDRADPDEAFFLALGGNQGDRVSLARNSVTRSGRRPDRGGIEWNAASHDGFGDTSMLWHGYP